jgi:tryptophan 2,3-dioxygenase
MPPLTYPNYLDLEKLLTLQSPRSTLAEHDETVDRSGAGAATGALPTR